MPNLSPQARNYFLANYAVALSQGQTIRGKAIRTKTIENYLSAAYQLFYDRRIDYTTVETDYVEVILKTLRDYESVPNRRAMITDGMTRWMSSRAATASPDSAISAINDWLMIGRYAGLRKSEWCQSSSEDFERLENWPNKPSMAFIASDFTFLGANQEVLTGARLRADLVKYVTICWRHQKNKQNGQKITFACDPSHPAFCPVRAALRIYLRALRLGVPAHEPIGVYRTPSGARRFITDTMVTSFFRDAAAATLDIKRTSSDIQQWSTHSLRVTAANLLHRRHLSDSFIQSRLRWRSNTFLDYLRNTIYAADEQAKALDISDSNLPSRSRRPLRELEPHEQVVLAARSA